MATLEELEQRVAQLHRQVDEQARARAGQDADLSDIAATLRAQQHSIQALGINSSEFHSQIAALRRELRSEVARLDSKLDTALLGIDSIASMLTELLRREG